MRTAVVTGAAGDIGLAIAVRFAREGIRVALIDIDGDRLEAGTRRSGLNDHATCGFACDLSDSRAIEATVGEIARRFGGVHLLVNNAATTTPRENVVALELADWNRTLTANLTSAFLMCKYTIPLMAAAGGGVIVNIASQLGHVAAPGQTAYSVSKAALIALTRGLAIDHAAQNIRAVSVSPGSILTSRLIDRYGSAAVVGERLAPRHPIGRIGTAEEVAATVAFLIGDGAAFITGADILVDGGYTAV